MEILPIRRGECLGDVVHVVEEAASEGDRLRRVVPSRGRRRFETREPFSERFVHEMLQATPPPPARALEEPRHVVVECEGRSHAS